MKTVRLMFILVCVLAVVAATAAPRDRDRGKPKPSRSANSHRSVAQKAYRHTAPSSGIAGRAQSRGAGSWSGYGGSHSISTPRGSYHSTPGYSPQKTGDFHRAIPGTGMRNTGSSHSHTLSPKAGNVGHTWNRSDDGRDRGQSSSAPVFDKRGRDGNRDQSRDGGVWGRPATPPKTDAGPRGRGQHRDGGGNQGDWNRDRDGRGDRNRDRVSDRGWDRDHRPDNNWGPPRGERRNDRYDRARGHDEWWQHHRYADKAYKHGASRPQPFWRVDWEHPYRGRYYSRWHYVPMVRVVFRSETPPPLLGSAIVASDDTFLGIISRDWQDGDSISNPYGRFGCPDSPWSIWNAGGQWGNSYGFDSPWNPYATRPPRIYSGDYFLGYLTTNQQLYPRIDPYWLMDYLGIWVMD